MASKAGEALAARKPPRANRRNPGLDDADNDAE